jgi:hypothetical protein
MIMHRMTLARADLDDLHADSERWLAEQTGSGGRPPGRPRRAPGRGPNAGPNSRPPGPNGRPRRPRPPQP